MNEASFVTEAGLIVFGCADLQSQPGTYGLPGDVRQQRALVANGDIGAHEQQAGDEGPAKGHGSRYQR
jgi:hypothetical protein